MAKHRLKNLWEADPHCFHCGVETILLKEQGNPRNPRQATQEHLFKRQPGAVEPRTVLACHACNDRTSSWMKERMKDAMHEAVLSPKE